MTRTIKGDYDMGDISVTVRPIVGDYSPATEVEIDIRRDTLRETRFSRREAREVINALKEMEAGL